MSVSSVVSTSGREKTESRSLSHSHVVLFAGSTGLVGQWAVRLLKERPEFGPIHLILRREPSEYEPSSRFVPHLIDFESMTKNASPFVFPQADVAFCTLGSTLKKAGSQEAFARVDRDYVIAFAKAAKSVGVKTFVVVSALGANADSSVFYNKVKGEMEKALEGLQFPVLHILQPSLLLGERAELRPIEKLGVWLGPLLQKIMVGPLAKWAPIEAERVAKHMLDVSLLPIESTQSKAMRHSNLDMSRKV
jgi:uncharacterized protein YbjT (DUF2867 family)